MTKNNTIPPKEVDLNEAIGRNFAARDIANNFALKWCKRAVQMVMAAVLSHDIHFSKKMGNMFAPVFQRAARGPVNPTSSGVRAPSLTLG
jgi:hypothetical protein